MKIDARIEWVIDDKALGIASGTEEIVPIDIDYVDPSELDIIEAIENELERKYKTFIQCSRSLSDDGDFVVKNMQDIVDDLNIDWE